MIKAILFDFNGTLYQDADINEITWKNTLNIFSKGRLDFDEFYNKYKSTHDHLVFKEVIKTYPDLKNENIDYWVNHKESAYRQYCLDHKRNQMTNGAEKFLDYIKERNIKIGLCTSSPIENVEFYYSNVRLNRWFKMDNTIYDDGTYTSKTEMYLDCAARLNEKIEDCLIIEDSPKPIIEAIKTGCKNVIVINNKYSKDLDFLEIKQKINDFNELDYSILDK